MKRLRKPFQLSYRDRTLRFTPEGFRFFLITLGVGIAALNTGNNLLYMVLAMMLSLIVVSGILSEQSIKKVSLGRSLPQSVFAESLFWIGLRLTNLKRFVPSFSLKIEDITDGDVPTGSCYVLKIPAQQTVSVSYSGQFQRRGRHAFTGFRLTTRYPFGFFIKTREIRARQEIIVYPKLLAQQFQSLKNSTEGKGKSSIIKKASEGDFLGLRDYRFGDDFRSIHWKSSAKLSNLVVKEFEAEPTDRVSLVFDRTLPDGSTQNPEESFETAVSLTATVVLRLDQRGFQTRLLTQGNSTPFGQGIHHVLKVFRILSLVEPHGATGREPQEFAGARGSGQSSVVIISAHSGSFRALSQQGTSLWAQDTHQAIH